MKTNRTLIIAGACLLATGILIGWWVGGANDALDETHQHSAESAQVEVWTCAMHPQIRQPEAGQCPICGMDLIPITTESSNADPMAVKMSDAAMQLADVQTSLVGYSDDAEAIRLDGKVQPNERMLRSQASHVSGRIEKLFVDFTGEFIEEGTPLARIYSPELVTAQKELIIAASVKLEQPALYEAAKAKLRNWKLTDEQIESLATGDEASGTTTILATTTGYVLERNVGLGDYVKKGQSLFNVVDLSSVWLMFDVYESQLQWVKKGDKAQISIGAFSDKTWTGTIAYVDPVIDAKTRVAHARVELANPGYLLKPEMFGKGIIQTRASKEEVLAVPKSAVMWTGKRSLVYIKTKDENGVYFRMREVELGAERGDQYEVHSGLQFGEEIATNGTFSIDAAAQLASKPSMMNPEGGVAPMAHDHGAMKSNVVTEPAAKPEEDVHEKPHSPNELNGFIMHYLELKAALTESNFEGAKSAYQKMDKTFVGISMSAFQGTGHQAWMQQYPALKESMATLKSSADLEAMRKEFKPFSAAFIELLKSFDGFEHALYIQYCPMADANKGGYWISSSKEIKNPYFGERMMSCGATKAEL
ncbi:MAG: efflux RND transporter periplasmic adaptor subunit [Flavobacteriales bacterium]|nr:efflux RND transporter periplasmic adaptor subunit [Flavobacteriales bacterium]